MQKICRIEDTGAGGGGGRGTLCPPPQKKKKANVKIRAEFGYNSGTYSGHFFLWFFFLACLLVKICCREF